MTLLTAIVFATPFWLPGVGIAQPGVATAPGVSLPPSASFGGLEMALGAGSSAASASSLHGGATGALSLGLRKVPPLSLMATEEGATEADDAADFRAYAEDLRKRNELATVHRAFGIATWGSMLVTVTLGFIQYINQYGFFSSREDTPCVSGSAIFGQDQCWGQPWPHRIAAITTTALYTGTFTLSLLMPDPNQAAEGSGAFAEKLRIHKALRWVHFGGMIAQLLFGLVIGQNWFGLDRANNYDTLHVLAGFHQLVGWTTFGTMTAAAAVMLF